MSKPVATTALMSHTELPGPPAPVPPPKEPKILPFNYAKTKALLPRETLEHVPAAALDAFLELFWTARCCLEDVVAVKYEEEEIDGRVWTSLVFFSPYCIKMPALRHIATYFTGHIIDMRVSRTGLRIYFNLPRPRVFRVQD